MKKVTISTEALKAINEASKKAANIAAVRASGHDTVKLIPSLNISFNDMECVLDAAEPAFGWTLAVHDDAYYNANLAYQTHMKRHNVRVYESRGQVLRNYVKQLARDKHNRRRHLQSYSAFAYHLTRTEAENKARAQRHHDLVVRDIKALIRKMVARSIDLGVRELTLMEARSLVTVAVQKAHGDERLATTQRKYLERFTAREYDDFLDIAEAEFKVAVRKIAPAGKSESVAD